MLRRKQIHGRVILLRLGTCRGVGEGLSLSSMKHSTKRRVGLEAAARLLVFLGLAVSLTGCGLFDRKKKEPSAEVGSVEDRPEKKQPAIKDMSGDTSFQSFIGILRKAAERRDFATLATMMAPDFGYRWDTPPPGDNVFAYWDRNQLWGELSNVLAEDFAPKENFMVAPRGFAEDPVNYRGFRAGAVTVNGSWKLAYFVGDEPQNASAPGEVIP